MCKHRYFVDIFQNFVGLFCYFSSQFFFANLFSGQQLNNTRFFPVKMAKFQKKNVNKKIHYTKPIESNREQFGNFCLFYSRVEVCLSRWFVYKFSQTYTKSPLLILLVWTQLKCKCIHFSILIRLTYNSILLSRFHHQSTIAIIASFTAVCFPFTFHSTYTFDFRYFRSFHSILNRKKEQKIHVR